MKQTEEEVAESVLIEEDSDVWLVETLFNCLIEEKGGLSQDAKFSQSSLIEQHRADPDLRKLWESYSHQSSLHR